MPSISATTATVGADLPAITTAAGAVAGSVYNVSNWTGLTDFNGTSVGGENIKAAATTNLTNTDSALGTGTILTAGGNNVSITAKGVASTAASNGTITIGSATASDQPAGTASVTATGTAAGSTIGAIQVNGGTTVTVTQGTSSSAVAGTGSTTQGAVTVNGGKTTTTVTVNQAAAATALSASDAAAVTGVVAKTAVTGGAGVNAVTGVTGVNGALARTAAVGATTGNVTVQDVNYNTTKANTISSVSLTNFGNTVNVNTNVLSTLSLAGTAGASSGGSTVTINNSTAGGNPTANTTLALNLSGVGQKVNPSSATDLAVAAIVDTYDEITTLNIVNSTANSSISLDMTGLKTLNISGQYDVKAPLLSTAGTLAINVSGAAGFNDGNGGVYNATGAARALGAGLTLVSTSSGTVTVSLDPLTQSFSGSATGRSVITVYGNAQTGTFNAITGNGVADKLLIDGTTFGLTTAQQAKLTGFEQVGVSNTVAGTINLANLAPTATLIEVAGTVSTTSGGVAFTNAAAGAVMQINANTVTGAYSLGFADSATNAATLQLGKADNATAITVAQVGFTNSSGSSVSTLNVVSNNSTWTGTGVAPINTISALEDLTLGTVNLTGNAGLVITALTASGSAGTNAAATFSMNNNTSTAGAALTLTTLTDNNLTTLNMGGTGKTSIGTLTSSTTSLTINNTGTGTVVVGDHKVTTGPVGTYAESSTDGFLGKSGSVNTTLTTLNLNGDIQIGANGYEISSGSALTTPLYGTAIGATSGVTVNGSTDNAHVTLVLRGALAGKTDTITLGNGNNMIGDYSSDGTVNITSGTGANYIDAAGNTGGATMGATYFANVTVAADAGTAATLDHVLVSQLGGAATNQYNTVLTGFGYGDQVEFRSGLGSAVTWTVSKLTATYNTLTDAIAAIKADANAGDTTKVSYIQYEGNTYAYANGYNSSGSATGDQYDSSIKLVGLHTLGATGSADNTVNILT